MFKRTILAVSVAALTFTGVAQAQENATLTLRSGERINAQLVDLGGVGFTVRINGAERQIPTNDVAVIDFTGGTMSDADWSRIDRTGSRSCGCSNGDTVNGQLYDIGGTSPLRITFKTSSGEREFSSGRNRADRARTAEQRGRHVRDGQPRAGHRLGHLGQPPCSRGPRRA